MEEAGEMQWGMKMLAFIAAWGGVYVITRLLLPARSKDFCNRCVSLLHVAVSVYLCSASVQNWSRPLDGIGAPSTHAQMLAITVSLAYFIYDSICCFMELPFDMENAVHHVISVSGLAFGYLHASSGSELVACLMLVEVSNPFMHARELLKELKLKDTSLSLMNDVAFAAVFTIARVILGPYLVYKTLESPNSPVSVKAGALGIELVSLFWFWKIARMVMYKLNKSKKAKRTRKAA